jgi:hypothetical protein
LYELEGRNLKVDVEFGFQSIHQLKWGFSCGILGSDTISPKSAPDLTILSLLIFSYNLLENIHQILIARFYHSISLGIVVGRVRYDDPIKKKFYKSREKNPFHCQ